MGIPFDVKVIVVDEIISDKLNVVPLAQYSNRENTITISAKYAKNLSAEKILETISHELTHAVQDMKTEKYQELKKAGKLDEFKKNNPEEYSDILIANYINNNYSSKIENYWHMENEQQANNVENIPLDVIAAFRNFVLTGNKSLSGSRDPRSINFEISQDSDCNIIVSPEIIAPLRPYSTSKLPDR